MPQGVPLFDVIGKRMRHSSQRVKVATDNIARSDMAGEKANEVKDFKRALKEQSTLNMTTHTGLKQSQTNNAHLANAPRSSGPYKVEKSRDVFEITPTGNTIDLEEQALEIDEAKRAHKQAATLYTRFSRMWRMATGGGQ